MPLRVSEINFKPHDAHFIEAIEELDVDADQFEFIEVTNTGDQTMNLRGIRLIERQVEFADHGIAFVFADQELPPGQAVVVVNNREAFVSRYGDDMSIAAGTDGRGGANGEFTGELADQGEWITLMDARGRVIQQFEFSPSIERTRGHGSSLEIVDPKQPYDDAANWAASRRFGGSPGVLAATTVGDVVISELKSADPPANDGWIELQNTTQEPIDIGGWYLSDSIDNLLESQVPTGIIIPKESYRAIGQSRWGFTVDRNRGGSLWLIESDDRGVPIRFVDQVQLETTREGISVGRSPADPTRLIPLTQSTRNTQNQSPAIGDIVISEINYHARDLDGEGGQQANNFEFVELLNRSEVEIDLSGWRITGDVDLSFRRGPTLGPGESVLAVSFAPNRSTQAAPFREAYGIDRSAAMAGPYLGRLSDSKGVVRIERPLEATPDEPFLIPYMIVDEVKFDSRLPWPESPHGSGQTLNRTTVNRLGNFATSWTDSAPSPGVSELPRRWTGDANEDGRFDTSDLVHTMQAGKYETAIAATFAEGDWNRDGFFDSADLLMAAATDRFEAPV